MASADALARAALVAVSARVFRGLTVAATGVLAEGLSSTSDSASESVMGDMGEEGSNTQGGVEGMGVDILDVGGVVSTA